MSECRAVFERRPFEPWVTLRSEEFVYHLPVDCSVVTKVFPFVITKRHLSILETDPERFYFLFALLHHAYQMRNLAAAPDTDANFDRILFEPEPKVEKFLDQADAVSNGAISAHVSRLTARDLGSLGQGQWFKCRN